MNKLLLLLCLAILSMNISLAAPGKIYRNKLNSCIPSKVAINNYEPQIFQPSNNLLRSPGATPSFCGKQILVKGTVLDKNCVPISDAKVYLWQVGCDGKYPYQPLRNKIDKKHINTAPKSSFQGSGTATTDNEGHFQFITIDPAKSEHDKPHLNLRVEHRDIGNLQTKLLLHDQTLDDEGSYNITIVLDKANLYRRY